MGYFRRRKAKNHTLAECREECRKLEYEMSIRGTMAEIRKLADEWAVWRELWARLEGENHSDVR